MANKVLIVGAGQAGMQVAVSLRELEFDGQITVVGDESYEPYQRPPLSKAYLAGESDFESLSFRSPEFYENNKIEIVTDQSITQVSLTESSGQATSHTGKVFDFDRLVLAPGSTPRKLNLPGHELSGVLYLRSLEDADELKKHWSSAQSVVVIGGGFIGLEVAAQATKNGKQATVLEAGERLIARAVSPFTSESLKNSHERRGTNIRLSVGIDSFVGTDGKVTGVKLATGEIIAADIVMIGIGVVARAEIAQQLGLEISNGAILVNEFAETSNALVLAAGDAVMLPSPMGDASLVRLESVQNAVDQAKVVASTIVGERLAYKAVPWFWSDQADLKLQIAGLSAGYDHTVVRGNPTEDKFSVLYYRSGKILAIDAVNDAPDYMAVRRALTSGANISASAAADSTTPLKSLIVEATN